MSTTAEPELFDSSEYRVPFPQADGHEVTDIVLRLGGTIRLNRNDPDHAALVESLTLGRHLDLAVSVSVDSKAQGIRFDSDDRELVTHLVGLKIHSVEP